MQYAKPAAQAATELLWTHSQTVAYRSQPVQAALMHSHANKTAAAVAGQAHRNRTCWGNSELLVALQEAPKALVVQLLHCAVCLQEVADQLVTACNCISKPARRHELLLCCLCCLHPAVDALHGFLL